MTYDILGSTLRKTQKRLLIVGETRYGKYLLKVNKDGTISDCGRLMSEKAWENTNVGDQYLGYMNSIWVRMDVSDVAKHGGKIFSERK